MRTNMDIECHMKDVHPELWTDSEREFEDEADDGESGEADGHSGLTKTTKKRSAKRSDKENDAPRDGTASAGDAYPGEAQKAAPGIKYACSDCDLAFHDYHTLLNHTVSKHPDQLGIYTGKLRLEVRCPVCGPEVRGFQWETALYRHVIKCHPAQVASLWSTLVVSRETRTWVRPQENDALHHAANQE
ncbi:hypothetical protein EIP91_001625 [Steccherinum ochraceum]|uniref:C2H2-type domain-containing protein n=1 Tax=Steccherinum ochraceum TaxID=92696 RepID=A0A4R0RG56_9APHY|nr:hypothetical protein EIP91_001625 [Steccherinum ochraceum]